VVSRNQEASGVERKDEKVQGLRFICRKPNE
jgi:hypothetical protein